MIITNWNEVIATFAAKTASDKDEAQDVVVIDEESVVTSAEGIVSVASHVGEMRLSVLDKVLNFNRLN